MKYYILIVSLLLLSTSCSKNSDKISLKDIEREIEMGNYDKSRQLINLYIGQNDLSREERYEMDFKKDVLNRVELDFSKTKEDVLEYIKKYYPEVNDQILSHWEEDGSLESLTINGEKRYFNRAAPNLFRINKEAKKQKESIDGLIVSEEEKVLDNHLPNVINQLKETKGTQTSPVRMKVKYSVTLNPNAVPDGEIVRCWLPYPRKDNRRQTNIELISVSDPNYIESPDDYMHKTIYMQAIAEKGKALSFSVEFAYTSVAEWFDLKNKPIMEPYDTNSFIYREYTKEREPHIVFSDRMKEVSKQIIGEETNPYQKVRKIFQWINQYPWAGAREYSTLENIPEYVLDHERGDCGQAGLLFITLARYNGIPAKWQSGFMMHPGGVNLHDWAEVYFEGIGWIPVDQSFGRGRVNSADENIRYFFSNGIDAYRWIVNDDYSQPLYPAKIYPRSETVDFQRGELEWKGGNIYFNDWKWNIDVEYLD